MSRLRSSLPILLLLAVPYPLAAQPAAPPTASKTPSHPAEVALMDEGDKGYVYRRFPSGQRLYTHDRDPAGGSAYVVKPMRANELVNCTFIDKS